MASGSSTTTSEESSGTSATIDQYITEARRLRTSLRRTKGSGSVMTSPDLASQLMIPVGIMYHSEAKGRGVHIRGGRLRNIILRSDTTYQRMLKKCVQEIYTEEEQKDNDFYIADSRGIAIWNGDRIEVDIEGSGERARECEWTLDKFIKLSNAKYPSKAKFYCVKKAKVSKDNDSDAVTGNDPDDSNGDRESESNEGVEESTGDDGRAQQVDSPESHPLSQDYCPDIWKPFEPMFIKRKKSEYRNQFSFRTITQRVGLCDAADDIHLRRSSEDESPRVGYMSTNPLHIDDFYFAGMEMIHMGNDINLVDTCDKRTGNIIYKKPQPDSVYSVWTGGYCCPGEEVSLLACVVKHGYHSVSKYQWYKGETSLDGECHPLLYATMCGVYRCNICVNEGEFTEDFCFTVTEDENSQKVIAPVSDMSIQDVAMKRLSQLSLVKSDKKDANKLVLLDVIGQGSFGTVHAASWRGSLVAAKVIPVQVSEATSIAGEIDILRKLQHPNLSTFLGAETVAGGVAILSPLIAGSNLHDQIFGTRRFTFPEKLYICIQVCQAVTYLHTSAPPMAHLDIKPANILVDSLTMHATLTDFGFAKAMGATAVMGTRTMMAGSPGYQAPEQLRAESLGPHCDIYAFGCVMIVLFQERQLWPGLNPYQILCKVSVNKEMPDMSDLTSQIKSICVVCVSEKECRPEIGNVLNDLLCIAKGISVMPCGHNLK